MGILSLITLLGVWMERKLPLNISSIIYISVMGIVLAFPTMPTSEFVSYYVSKVEVMAIVTVFLALPLTEKLYFILEPKLGKKAIVKSGDDKNA